MKVLDIRPKGVYVAIEFSAEQLEHIADFLGSSECKYDSEKEPKMEEAIDYVTKILFPTIDKILEDIKEDKIWR
jgi:hypothetical protein